MRSQRSRSSSRKGFVAEFETYRLWIITWGELLDDIRRKYESFRSSLEVVSTTEHGLDYVRRVHSELLPLSVRDTTNNPDGSTPPDPT